MKRIVNPHSVRPIDLQPGHVMVCTVTLHVTPRGDGMVYRMYRSPWPVQQFDEDGIPQGTRMGNEKAIMQECFPVAGWAGAKPDLM